MRRPEATRSCSTSSSDRPDRSRLTSSEPSMPRLFSLGLVAATVISAAAVQTRGLAGPRWSKAERETLRSLSLSSLGPLPADPSNRYGDDTSAARLGPRLFVDTRLSGNGKLSRARSTLH